MNWTDGIIEYLEDRLENPTGSGTLVDTDSLRDAVAQLRAAAKLAEAVKKYGFQNRSKKELRQALEEYESSK